MNKRMRNSRIALVVASGLLISAIGFAVQQVAWKRTYLGKTAFSISLPGTLEDAGETKVEDKADWVSKTDDYVFEDDNMFILISVFHGKPGTVASTKHLATVGKDLVTGISEGENSVRENGRKEGVLDDKPTLLQSHILGKDREKNVFKSFLLGDGNKVFAVMAIGFPDDPKSVAAIDRALSSIRYKMGVQ